jgi:hypothetical protein
MKNLKEALPLIGKTLGHYRVVQEQGRGGMEKISCQLKRTKRVYAVSRMK